MGRTLEVIAAAFIIAAQAGWHAQARAYCGAACPEIGRDFDDQPGVSPPIIYEPVAECARAIEVNGVQPNAVVHVFRNGSGSPEVSVPAGSLGGTVWVQLASPVNPSDTFRSLQEIPGVDASGFSFQVLAAEQSEAFAPPANVSPQPLYFCSRGLGVEGNHPVGAQVRVFEDRSDVPGGWVQIGERAVPHSGAYSWFWASLFNPYTAPSDYAYYTAEWELCGGNPTPTVYVHNPDWAPSPLPSPEVRNGYFDASGNFIPAIFPGEPLVVGNVHHGSTLDVFLASNPGSIAVQGGAYWDIDHIGDVGIPFSIPPGESVAVRASFCDALSGPFSNVVQVATCDELPPADPFLVSEGDRVVRLRSYRSGSVVRVYGQSGEEIGQGGGSTIALYRPILANEAITFTVALDGCTSRFARVVNSKNIPDSGSTCPFVMGLPAANCNACVDNVLARWAELEPDVKDLWEVPLSDHQPLPPGGAWRTFPEVIGDSHFQGAARLPLPLLTSIPGFNDDNWMVLSHNREELPGLLFAHMGVAGASYAWSETSAHDFEFMHVIEEDGLNHPGGMQVVGDTLAVSFEKSGGQDVPSRVRFYGYEDPTAGADERSELVLNVGLPGISDVLDSRTSGVAMTKLDDGRYFVFVGGDNHSQTGWFFVSSNTEINSETEWEMIDSWQEWSSAHASAYYYYDNLAFITECTGDIYLIALGTSTAGSTDTDGRADLFRLIVNQGGTGFDFLPAGAPKNLEEPSLGGLAVDPSVRFGGAAHVPEDGSAIYLYSTSRRDRNSDVEIVQFTP